MILRKPYAFFIKIFKPVHLLLAGLVAYLIYVSTKMLSFLSDYIYSETSVVGQNIKSRFSETTLYFIPIILIVFSLLIFGIMYKKKKPFTFYIINIFLFIFVLIINIYTFNFLGVLEKTIVSVKTAKLMHDLTLINIMIESASFIFFTIRGTGLDFKKFSFDSDISKFNISESDKEEFELELKVDFDESRRKRNKKIRHLKYLYLENKFLVHIALIAVLVIISFVICLIMFIKSNQNKEGKMYAVEGVNVGVYNTYIVNTNYKGKKITDNYLIVLNARVFSNYSGNIIYDKDFSLNISGVTFSLTHKYDSALTDLNSNDTKYRLIVFEVPEKYLNSKMKFKYTNKGNSVSINLSPKKLVESNKDVSKKIGEALNFKDTIGNIEFTISNFEIKPYFINNYDYCINGKDCIPSKEYLKPSIDENFDKVILKVAVNYKNDSIIKSESFYDFFSNFASIYYKLGDKWYVQSGRFEEIVSNKKKDKDNTYIGVNSNISDASSIKLVFEIRGSKYEYILK